MDFDTYIAKKQELQLYRSNLTKLEHEIASYGGYNYAPLATRNHHDYIKERIDVLQGNIQAMAVAEIEKDAEHFFHRRIEILSNEKDTLLGKNNILQKLVLQQQNYITGTNEFLSRLLDDFGKDLQNHIYYFWHDYNDILTYIDDTIDKLGLKKKDKTPEP